MPKAYLIFGPEYSGTRMLTEYIIKCSGAFGDWGHYQSLDRPETFNHLKTESDIVWRRSLPHGKVWANIPEMTQIVESKGFAPVLIGIIREQMATVTSQLRNGHIQSMKQGNSNYSRAIELVETFCKPVIYYGTFVNSLEFRKNLLYSLGIVPPDCEPVNIRAELLPN